MSEAPSAQRGPRKGRRGPSSGPPPTYAALDLGTNNCRLLVASPASHGFRVVEAYSRIVRLGEGLSQSGRMSDEAMERALAALSVCAEKIRRRRCVRIKAVATQACRQAVNGPEFIARVQAETGLKLQIIAPKEEAQLSVAGCLNLLDREAEAALVIDVGGGSTELSWVDLKGRGLDARPRQFAHWRLPIKAWLSVPIGVVTLAERFPEDAGAVQDWFRRMVDAVKERIAAFPHAEPLRQVFEEGRAHLVGTSGAITSLAGLHLDLPRYDRSRVDGLWMTRDECETTTGRLLAWTPQERAAQPCIGPDRADLVLAGAAILQAVQELWPCARVRVADRGLREGLLLSLMSDQQPRRRRKRRSAAPRLAGEAA
ncbi:Ppx/GppA phosphatase family protein [Caulobacter mirabilis]|uniref:Exopolyphosphatase n=1 Tax=Caulobacter mirabilis TaxID=69666 RepID=A0A2D2AZH1_9CAUL|nr:Ppx/GppA phosphatase family protein [Caulobacter mirabilis]ATQ43395.1 exopolyphosphatase [Caulobacter mirabilis]